MYKFDSDFAYKGERKYINFATLMDEFRKVINDINVEVYDQLWTKNFKVHKYITRNSLIKVFDKSELEGKKHKENLIVEMNCHADDIHFFVGLYDENSSSVTKRIKFPDNDLVGPVHVTNPFTGVCEYLRFKDHHELIQAIGTANKQLHFLSLSENKLLYEIQSVLISDFVCPYEISTNKTRLDITNIAVKENSTHMFTMNQLTLNLNGHKQSFKLCYSVRKQQ